MINERAIHEGFLQVATYLRAIFSCSIHSQQSTVNSQHHSGATGIDISLSSPNL